MMTSANPLALLSRTLDQVDTVIDGIREEQAALPTPCQAWAVRGLVEHVIDDLGQFAVAATGGRPDWSGVAPSVDGDWGGAFREGARVLLAAWRRVGDLSGTLQLPIGEVPVTFVVNQQIAEFAVHSWDLAKATGQVIDLDPEIGEAALAWATTALRPEFRGDEDSGKAFGPEVSVAADAPVYDRLAAFFGRHPG
jgi:uncharacterized protein (TIGR03086 family)